MLIRQKNPQIWETTWQLLKQNNRFQQTSTSSSSPSEEKSAPPLDFQTEWQQARPFHEIPRSNAFDIVRGYLPGGKYRNKNFIQILALMKEEFGDVMYIPKLFGRPEIVLTYNPNDFETIYRNEGIWPNRPGSDTLDYHRSKHRSDVFQDAEGLISTQGEQWGKFRSIVNPVLMHPKNVRLYLQKMAQVNLEFVERIRKIRNSETNEMPENFEEEINRFTLESVSIVALDKQLGLLKSDEIDPIVQEFFRNLTEFFYLSGELDSKPSIWKIVATPKFKRLMKVLDCIQETTLHYVNEAIQHLEEEEKRGLEKPDSEKSVLEKLLKKDRKVATVMAMDMLMAGVDTTSSTFASVLLCLAKNPEKQEKLREEILRVLPTKDSEFTEKSLNEIPYLKACIKEALRCYPLINGNGRVVHRDVVIGGYQVPKGTQVIGVATTINRDEKIYSQPNEFLPERWLRVPKDDPSAKRCPNATKSSNAFAYLPFGFGPRSCIGRRIAELELELGIARIVRNFDIAFNYPTENAFKTLLINVPNIPLKFQLTDIKN